MQLIETASQKRPNPRTLRTEGCMKYGFSTGHSVHVFADGLRFYHNKNGGALNPRTGAKLIAAMDAAIAKAEGK